MPDSAEYTVRDAITRLEDVNRLGKSNLSDKGVEILSESPTTLEIVNGIEQIEPKGLQMKVGNFTQLSARANIGASVIMEV